jgi:rubrerythrin
MPNREKIIKAFETEIMNFTPACTSDELLKEIMETALELLKKQKAIEPKTGNWIESKCLDECFWVCSECNFPSEAIAAPQLYKYCPNCGTKMAERR